LKAGDFAIMRALRWLCHRNTRRGNYWVEAGELNVWGEEGAGVKGSDRNGLVSSGNVRRVTRERVDVR